MVSGTSVRPTAVAGLFYPADAVELEKAVAGMITSERTSTPGGVMRAIIAPHAGYTYSGRTAAAAYAGLKGSPVRRVIVLSPSHREFFEGISVYPGAAYETPLGIVPVDAELRDRLCTLCPSVSRSAAGHGQEHAIEVQLPFLQHMLPGLTFLPVVIGHQTRENCYALGEALGVLMKETELLVVASSDLSHYHPWAEANRLDRVFIEDVKGGDEELLMEDIERGSTEACGGGPVVAVMRALRRAGGIRVIPIRHTTSGDVTGDRSSVVGYLSAAAYG